MFLSMLVAWMIPDVPRSLREQLKKENMLLMEFLLNQDQEARAKTHSSKHCFPTNIDIVVEPPPEDQEESQVQVEEDELVGVEIISLDTTRQDSDSDPEVGNAFEEGGVNGVEERGGEGEEENSEVKEEEKDGEVKEEDGKEEDGKELFEKEESEEKEKEGQKTCEEETQAAESENYTVDLDAIMSELGLLGKKKNSTLQHKFSVHRV